MVSDRELAYFGGWSTRTVAGGDHAWGDPRSRVIEFVASVPSGLILPSPSEWLQKGVPLWVVNNGFSTCAIKRPDLTTIVTAAPDSVYMLVDGTDWLAVSRGQPQFGPLDPALIIRINLDRNEANVNLLAKVVAKGYDGTVPVVVICTVKAGTAIGTTERAHRAITTGTSIGGVSWFAGSYWVLQVEPDAIVGGWGGNGGRGGVAGTGAAAGFAGEDAGQAIRTEIPLRIDCRGYIFGGGGGGGGGDSSLSVLTTAGGGGGGGRGANMTGPGLGTIIGALGGGATQPAGVGTGGGPFSFGGGGLGAGNGGHGGRGGFAGEPGLRGNNVGNTLATGGLAGAAGAAVSYLLAAGAPTILNGAGNILGPIVSEVS